MLVLILVYLLMFLSFDLLKTPVAGGGWQMTSLALLPARIMSVFLSSVLMLKYSVSESVLF
jgi:hypothetical protein